MSDDLIKLYNGLRVTFTHDIINGHGRILALKGDVGTVMMDTPVREWIAGVQAATCEYLISVKSEDVRPATDDEIKAFDGFQARERIAASTMHLVLKDIMQNGLNDQNMKEAHTVLDKIKAV